MNMETLLSICLGIGLSAACGFRIFVPLLCVSIASLTGHLQLDGTFAWIGTPPAAIAFGAATALEIAAYYIPFVDNALDTIAVPVATIAGILVSAMVMTDVDPLWRWSLAVIAGGGLAASTQLATTKARAASSVTTAGAGNPVLATIEAIMATVLSVVAVLWPIIALILVIGVLAACWAIIYFVGKQLLRFFRGKAPATVAVS